MLSVSDLMTDKVFFVAPDDNLAHAYDLMSNHHIRHLPVVSEDGELTGILTHRDLIRSTFSATTDALPMCEEMQFLRATKVRECMTNTPETISPDAPLTEAATILLENKYGCLPVVHGDTLVGILTEADFVRYVQEIQQSTGVTT